jgi:hypothetical protein
MPDVVGGAVTEWVSVGRSQTIAVIKAGQPQASIKGARVQAQLALELKKTKECKAAAAKLWRKCYREAELAGFEQNGELVHGSPFQPAKRVMMAAAKLGEIAFEARKVGGAVYRGTRKAAKYAKEVGTDLYHGAREAHRTHRSNPRLSTCAQQYLETALWSSTDEDGRPLDDQFDVSDFAPEAIRQAEKDCLDFLSTNDVGDLDEGDVGHNFWLTRNHHGAGFWDRGLGALGYADDLVSHAAALDLWVDHACKP